MKNLMFILLGCTLLWACNQPKPEPAPTAEPVKQQPLEIGDSKYIDIAKQAMRSLFEGNVDGFVANLSDDARFEWNYLDSLQGKKAISDYWKDRRGNVIDTLTASGEIWLTVKANEPPAPNLPTGTWVFSWYKVTAKYKTTGKSMTQWIHQVQHFNANDKIDYISQFLDRVPIQAATKK